MTSGVGLSVVLGVAFGLAYYASSVVTHRIAARHPRVFFVIALGGMLIRMMLCLAAVALALVFLPVRPLAFVGTFMALFVVGLALEITRLHRSS